MITLEQYRERAEQVANSYPLDLLKAIGIFSTEKDPTIRIIIDVTDKGDPLQLVSNAFFFSRMDFKGYAAYDDLNQQFETLDEWELFLREKIKSLLIELTLP